jgi:lipoprotein NlpD
MRNHTITKFALTILALGLLNGCDKRSGPPASVHYDKAVSPYHVVKKGDSIASIARKYGMDKRELIRTNGLESPYRIVKGQRLLVRAHKTRENSHDDMDETEAPPTEEVSSVPEEEGVHVKPLAPVAGLKGDAHPKNGVKSEGRMNPEVDDEVDTEETIEGENATNKRKFDEDNLDEAEGRSKRKKTDEASEIPHAAGTYTMPVEGRVINSFSAKGKGKIQNDGINIAAPKGAPVVAANNGVVVVAKKHVDGFGYVVILRHDNGTMTVYGHLDKDKIIVAEKQIVKAGQKLASVGQSGKAKEPQLFFQVREQGKIVDPKKYVNY